MAGDLLGKRSFSLQHVPHDLAERGGAVKFSSSLIIMVHFQIGENLKEAEVRPELLPSSSTSLPIRSLNDVGDCVLLCGGRTLCLACAKKRMSQNCEISLCGTI